MPTDARVAEVLRELHEYGVAHGAGKAGRSAQAATNLQRAGLRDVVELRVQDAAEALRESDVSAPLAPTGGGILLVVKDPDPFGASREAGRTGG